MLWRDLRAAIKTEMAARRQAMKQSDRAKGSERAVALMVERIKSTETYAQMGVRLGITADRARELVARGVRGQLCAYVWTAPSWQELSSRLQHWSVQPCVRPLDAVHMTAGHNALRRSAPGHKPAFGNNAMAQVGCPDRRLPALHYVLFPMAPPAAFLRAAWVQEFNPDRSIANSFLSVPGIRSFEHGIPA